MRMHPSAVKNILTICTTHGGHKDEKRLISFLQQVRLSPVFTPEINFLVDTVAYIQKRRAAKQPENDIIPMSFHTTTVEHVLKLYTMYSGHSNESKLNAALSSLDLIPYERKGTGEHVLLTAAEYNGIMNGTKAKT
jgi:hypothetical protein